MNLLLQLEILLYKFKKQIPVKKARDSHPGELSLDNSGIVIFTRAVSKKSVTEAKQNLCNEMGKMWKNICTENDLEKLSKGDLSILDYKRNSEGGFGNVSFGYFFKQPPKEYKNIDIFGENIAFDINTIYSGVNIKLLLHPNNIHTTALLLGLGNKNGIISPDSAKYSINPKPKPKKMTKQSYTMPHMDIYNNVLNRIQAIINVDIFNTKLFFVPGTHDSNIKKIMGKILSEPDFFLKKGYISIKNDDLINILIKYAIASPPYSLVAWKSGIVHFEGIIDKKIIVENNYLYSCKKIGAGYNQQRLRFIVGTHTPILSKEKIIKLALLAKGGILPAVYPCNQNKGTEIDKNIVCKKTTQYKKLRKVSKYEKIIIDLAQKNIEEKIEKIIPNKLERHLYGISQNFNKLCFSKNDLKFLEKI